MLLSALSDHLFGILCSLNVVGKWHIGFSRNQALIYSLRKDKEKTRKSTSASLGKGVRFGYQNVREGEIDLLASIRGKGTR
ncbi:putative phosphoribulose kinase [Corchorus olitorius]|uniref:Phosphoribulose kinase n=1 Tax=Corchorus olitorius TaxID=93759 RepID=A0A1R3KCK6_9ROSI|nr:putative phosphoribulose kinase [Corchorus olitorius]